MGHWFFFAHLRAFYSSSNQDYCAFEFILDAAAILLDRAARRIHNNCLPLAACRLPLREVRWCLESAL